MDSDLKNIDKISANLGPDDLGGDNPDINNIKSKYILTYSDIKKVIFKDLYGNRHKQPKSITGNILKNYGEYLDRLGLPPTLKKTILDNINSDGSLDFDKSIIFHKAEKMYKNDKNIKNKLFKVIKNAINNVVHQSNRDSRVKTSSSGADDDDRDKRNRDKPGSIPGIDRNLNIEAPVGEPEIESRSNRQVPTERK